MTKPRNFMPPKYNDFIPLKTVSEDCVAFAKNSFSVIKLGMKGYNITILIL